MWSRSAPVDGFRLAFDRFGTKGAPPVVLLHGSQVFVVQRTGTKVIRSIDAAFDYDAVQVRATARVSFGFANPAGIVRLYDAA